ncbi:protease HtpX [Candidatus Ishikawella capsulata]|uniref:Heat shock protein HtpX n=1 Tax=Candidatus Ishikawaella capsulata Mpkobe TaxID=476281 RepID=C5WCN0_9ENTR|nr:protease HtpX [Candidatus Ishikawaella capsulata]BAH83086.1 heat shock protein HtpX [Candidatus Ishikawaella capsulata Mpkobe]
MLRRIILFALTNLSVMLVFGIFLYIAGIQFQTIYKIVISSGLVGLGSVITTLRMSKEMVLKSVQGVPINIKEPKDKQERFLVETIQRQRKRLHLPMPEILVYKANNVNAFAAGCRKNSAVIGVSTGLLKNLEESEVEAVLAHEMSHIFNGDMVTMTLIQGIINAYVGVIANILAQISSNCVSGTSETIAHHRSMVHNLCSKYLKYILFGVVSTLIINKFSRYREYYADAGSASIVGTEKMIAALKKLKLSYPPKEPDNIQIFCINGKRIKFFPGLFSTHPSINNRIKALIDGKYIKKVKTCSYRR